VQNLSYLTSVKYKLPNKNNFRSHMIHAQNTFHFKILVHILNLIIFGLAELLTFKFVL